LGKEKQVKIKHVFIDNDILIYLANGDYRDEDEILGHLEQLVNKGEIELLVPDNLMDEWERNKQSKIRDALLKSLSGRIGTLRELKNYLEDEHYEVLNNIINEIRSHETYFKNTIEKRIERIEYLLNHSNTKRLSSSINVKAKAAEMSLLNQMPFKNKKNSMGDAFNFLTCLEHQSRTEEPEVHFITNNKNDFGKKDNQGILHEDFETVANDMGVTIHYSINIGEKLQEFGAYIKPETRKTIQDIQDSLVEYGSNRYGFTIVTTCCGEPLSEGAGIYIGGNLHSRCKKCGKYYDSGISFD
jgi:hypothetical protein